MLYIFSDIQFWNKNKSMEGLSAKSVVVNFFCQLIVFLYLLDNETSWMILASSGIGCCIEFWKIGKAMHIEVCVTVHVEALKFVDVQFYTVYNIIFSFRLIDLVQYQCWGFVIVIHMLQTRQRSMMILQWSTCHMSSFFLLFVSRSTLSSMNNTRAGILGSFHPLRAVSTCLVSIFILFPALLFSLMIIPVFLIQH